MCSRSSQLSRPSLLHFSLFFYQHLSFSFPSIYLSRSLSSLDPFFFPSPCFRSPFLLYLSLLSLSVFHSLSSFVAHVFVSLFFLSCCFPLIFIPHCSMFSISASFSITVIISRHVAQRKSREQRNRAKLESR